jgi:hypothetical protein
MLNFDPDFFYNKDLGIISPVTTKEKPAAIKPSLSFFPEGGDAVAGINCKIAFKANDQWGRPINIAGSIVDDTGKQVAGFTSTHDGMGFFLLAADPNTSYRAKWNDEHGIAHTTNLPQVKQAGLAMQIVVQGDKRVLHVHCTGEEVKKTGMVHIIGTMFQRMVLNLDEVIDKEAINKTIPLQSLPDGILTITVFDQQWQPLAERITFVNNNNALFETLMEVRQKGIGKREKNELQVTVPDSFATSISVAITDEGIGREGSSNIVSHLLLASELKGTVYNSAYYFSGTDDSIVQHLDLVMLTHGWRRFKWGDVINGKFPEIIYDRDTNYLSLSGKLTGASAAQLRRNKEIFILTKMNDGGIRMTEVPIRADGSFIDPGLLFFDTMRLGYSFPKKSRLAQSSIQFIDGRMAPYYNKNLKVLNSITDTAGYWQHAFFAEQENYLRKTEEGELLKEVIVTSTIKKPLELMDEKYSSGMFRGGDNYQFDITNDPLAKSSGDIFAYLVARVPGLLVNRGANGASLSWRGGSPLFYIDEVRVGDSTLTGMSLSSIAYLKIFRPPFSGAPFGGTYGAIAMYTKRGYDAAPTGNKEMTMYGYTSIHQFYSPNYEITDAQQERKDFRTTLYWNPNVATAQGNNKAILSFYNNDVSRSFRVIIEGISREGKMTHHEEVIR